MTVPLSTTEREFEPEGLKDGGHVYPGCTNCGCLLMDLFITRPHEPFSWTVRAANCPFCDERWPGKNMGGSDPVLVRGGFHVGGYGRAKPDDESDDVPSTAVERDELDGGTFVFFLKKARADSKPYKGGT
jgi:hypothetical protein